MAVLMVERMAAWSAVSKDERLAVMWAVMFIFGGYLFGNMQVVKNNFGLVILVIIVLSILPGVIEYLRQRKKV